MISGRENMRFYRESIFIFDYKERLNDLYLLFFTDFGGKLFTRQLLYGKSSHFFKLNQSSSCSLIQEKHVKGNHLCPNMMYLRYILGREYSVIYKRIINILNRTYHLILNDALGS